MSEELEYIMTEPYQRGYKKGKADAIEVFSKAVKEIYFESEIDEMLLNKILERLKEQSDENNV